MQSGGKKLLCFAMAFLISTMASVAARAGVAEIIGVKGAVEVQEPGGAWMAAELKQELQDGTVIRTGPGAGAVVMMPNGSTIKLNEETEFTITDPSLNDGLLGELDEGDLWSLVEAGDQPLRINTPSAVVGVRGTEFVLGVAGGGESTVTVVAGLMSFGNEFGQVNVGTSQQSSAAPGEAPTPPVIVDTKHWIQWTLDLRAMGSDIETPFIGGEERELRSMLDELQDEFDQNESPRTAFDIGKVLYDLGEYDASSDIFDFCYGYDETYLDCLYGYGMAKLARGDVDFAEDAFRELVDSQEPSARGEDYTNSYLGMGYFGIGMIYLKLDMPDEAEKYFNYSLDYDPGHEMSLVGLAEVRIREGKADAAADLLEEALDVAPDTYQALLRLALVNMAGGDIEKAKDEAEEAADIAPHSPAAWSTLGRVNFFAADYAGAENAARKAVNLDRYSPGGHEVLARLLILEDRLKEAISEALVSLAFNERNPYANDDLALIYYLYRKYDEAIRHWEKAIESDPNYNMAKIRLAHLYNELEETGTARRAEELAREVLGDNSKDDGAWSEMGRALEMLRKYKEAEEAYLKALELNPDEALHLGRLASFYIQAHKIDLAIEYAVEAVGAQPGNPRNYFILGRAYEAVDNLDGAEAAYLTALSLDPDYSLARYQLGIIYTALGESRDALAEMHTAALERPRIITLAEYRGANRIYAGAASHDTRFYEGVHTDSSDGYRLNYRLVLTGRESDGHRIVNGDMSRRGGSLLVGYQANADSSLVAYADFTHEDEGLPGPDTGTYANDPDDYETFESRRFDLSYRVKSSHRTTLAFRYGRGGTDGDEYYTDDTSLVNWYMNTDVDSKELEFRGDYEFSDRTTMTFGAFKAESDPAQDIVYSYYDFFTSGYINASYTLSDDYEQKNAYFRLRHERRPGLVYWAGYENAFHNVAGSQGLLKYGIDYRLNDREWLYFIRKDLYRLNYFPRYQPRDGWTWLSETDVTIPGTESRQHEIKYEARLNDGSFFKAALFHRKSWQYDSGYDFTNVSVIYEQKGYRAEYEKQLSRKANMFVAVSSNSTKLVTPGNTYDGNNVPYTPTRDYTAGLYYFFSSRTTLKTLYQRYGKRYINYINDEEIDDFKLVTMQLRYDPRIDQSYMLTVYNVFDEEYEFTQNYPEDGRSYELSFIRWF